MKFELTTRIDEAGNDVPCFGICKDDEIVTGNFQVWSLGELAAIGLDFSDAHALRIANRALSDDFYSEQTR